MRFLSFTPSVYLKLTGVCVINYVSVCIYMSQVRGLLTVDPKKRMTGKQVLAHPWIVGEGVSSKAFGSQHTQRLKVRMIAGCLVVAGANLLIFDLGFRFDLIAC
jgi:hypothetical protein